MTEKKNQKWRVGHFFPRRKKKHSNWIIFLSIHHLPHLTRSTSPLPPRHQSWLFPLIFWEVMAAQFTAHTIGQQKGRQGVVNEGRVCVCVSHSLYCVLPATPLSLVQLLHVQLEFGETELFDGIFVMGATLQGKLTLRNC